MHIKVMPDYDCHPLWWDNASERIGNIDPRTLQLTLELISDLEAWASDFDQTLNRADPPATCVLSNEEQRQFDQRGRMLAVLLADELGSRATVRFWKP